MLSDEGKLIVIHQFPRPNMQPFLNPICKDTYESLPKIYGRKGKKRYFLNMQEYIKNQNSPSCVRECCRPQFEETVRPQTDVKMPKKIKLNPMMTQTKSDNCEKKNCVCLSSSKVPSRQAVSPVKLVSPQNRLKRIILPNLKEFDSLEIGEAESRHKVMRPAGAMSLSQPRLLDSSKLESKMTHNTKVDVQSSRISSKCSYTQTMERMGEFDVRAEKAKAVKEVKVSHFEAQNPRDSNKRYYQYLQNDPRLREEPANTHNLKLSQASDASYVSSLVMQDKKELSTIFHQYKKKQDISSSNSYADKKQSKAYSVLSNGLFKIPEEEELEDFLLNYKPLNPAFNVKELAKEQDFCVVPSKDKVYFGQVRNDKKHGKGITVSEKDIYEGNYDNNLRVYGSEKNRDGVYTGEFLKGKRHGSGKFVWVNGEQFEGQWRDGKKNGHGVWKSPKGDFYQGEWKQNRQHGKGYYFHKGGSKYNGYFKDFLKQGKGEEEFPSGDKYTGEYKNGKPHGYGKYAWRNGDTYEGDFIEGSREGKGLLKRVSGEVYEGQFKNDMKHGVGKQKGKGGEWLSGEFEQGIRVRAKQI